MIHKSVASLPGPCSAFDHFQYILQETKLMQSESRATQTLRKINRTILVFYSLYPDPPPKRKGGSGEYSTASHHRLAFAMNSAKS